MSTSRVHFLCLSLAVACAPSSSDKVGNSDTSGPAAPTCDVTFTTSPVMGSSNHYHRDPIVFTLSDLDETAQVVTDVSGESSWNEDGTVLTFTPDEPLEPATEHTLALDYCRGESEITFTTSDLGLPVEPDVELEGLAYSLDFKAGQYTIGANAGELLNAIFTREVMFELIKVDGDDLDVRAAIGMADSDPVQQDPCSRTRDFEDIDISDSPYFSSVFENLEFGAQGGLLRFASFEVAATIASDAQTLGGLRYHAVLGVTEIAELLSDYGDIESLCDAAEILGIPCELCPDDDHSYCVTVAAEHIEAHQVDADLFKVEEAGVAPGCDER